MSNPDVRDAAATARVVWAGQNEPAWTSGGTYQVVQLVRFATELWNREPLATQEAVFGRRRSDRAPLGRDAQTSPALSTPPDQDDRPGREPGQHNAVRRRSLVPGWPGAASRDRRGVGGPRWMIPAATVLEMFTDTVTWGVVPAAGGAHHHRGAEPLICEHDPRAVVCSTHTAGDRRITRRAPARDSRASFLCGK